MEVKYEDPFRNLTCASAPPAGPPTASCFALRNSIPKAGYYQTFGSPGENVEVVLPLTLASGIFIPVPQYSLNRTADDGL